MSTSLDAPAPAPQVTTLACPHCGAPLALKAQGWAESVVCASCGSVMDATQGALRILQAFDQAVTLTPAIPLGTRGTWRGAPWEVVGCQQVTITVDDIPYSWREYVGFNPYRGFLYLSEYQGHWNVIEKLRRQPVLTEGGHPVATLDGRPFRHFQSAIARTTAALGEFPWQLRVGDSVTVADYVAPPHILSAEGTGNELTWSLGTYTPPEVIATAFALPTPLRRPEGVFANQPNPHAEGARRALRRMGVALLLLALLFGVQQGTAARTVAHTQRFQVTPAGQVAGADGNTVVTPPFTLDGRTSTVELALDTDLDNTWLFFDLTLINEATGATRTVGREVSYYRGTDSDGSWSEGSRDDRVRIGRVPPGRYFLRLAVDGDESRVTAEPVTYDVALTVRRDVPALAPYLLALLALVLPALVPAMRSSAFEGRRWAESDHAPEPSGGDDDDE
ncbi:MAG: DUF4178 domain-containing protein [Gemmatimonadetes bacterium]|nr:DUF4178 domain-containing protein [Gemmatimonadota bacterium]